MVRDQTGYPTLPEGKDMYFTTLKTQHLTGIVTSDGSFSVGTSGVTNSGVSYFASVSVLHQKFPGKLPVDRTWKIKDDEGNDWYIPLFTHG